MIMAVNRNFLHLIDQTKSNLLMGNVIFQVTSNAPLILVSALINSISWLLNFNTDADT